MGRLLVATLGRVSARNPRTLQRWESAVITCTVCHASYRHVPRGQLLLRNVYRQGALTPSHVSMGFKLAFSLFVLNRRTD